jgi:hypothetical protein
MLRCVTVLSATFLVSSLKVSTSEAYRDLIVSTSVEVAHLMVMVIDLMMGELLCYGMDTF